ncbi:MAG: DUF2092 domain-containing protein [Methylococcus sp.]|nr:DUF2092 domain-containing protein [Methylococcus sp.]
MKSKPWRPTVRCALYAAMLAAMAGCAAKPAVTVPAAPAALTPAPQAEAEPTEAKDILLRMAKFLANTQRFSVNVGADYDAVQESGEKIEFGQTLAIGVNRPNQLRVEAVQSDGDKHLVLYDGKDITAFTPAQGVYAQASKPGGIDEAVMYFLKDLKMKLPLAVLLVSRFPTEIESRTLALAYVEKTEIQGTPAHHLAGRTETVDYQVWIAQGAQPLPLRLVLTYKNAEGQPQFRARLSDWNLSPDLQDAQFAFAPPAGARKIAFLAEVPQIELQGTETPKKTGGRK